MGAKTSKSVTEIDTAEDDEEEEIGPEVLEIMLGTEYFPEETSLKDIECDKSELHTSYISIKELDLTKIPKPLCHESLLHYINCRAKLVVKVKVNLISNARPDTDQFAKKRGQKTHMTATGYAWICCEEQPTVPCHNKSCPYDKRPHDVYHGILITTNKHVIFNNEEAKETEIVFFYDDDDAETEREIVKCHGLDLRENLEQKDYVSLRVYHHSKTLFQMINDTNREIMEAWKNVPHDIKLALEKHAIVISHPHGTRKVVSFGELLDKEILQEDPANKTKFRKVTKYTCATCPGSSGAPVFSSFYWNNPFVHSSAFPIRKEESKTYLGMSFSY